MGTSATQIKQDIFSLKNPAKAKIMQRFFKTGKGEYGQGDVFYGLTVPQSRSIAKKYTDASFKDIETLLHSHVHEERLIALFILVFQFEESDDQKKKVIYDFYLSHTDRINNWDLVDCSAGSIMGGYLLHLEDRTILQKLARSKNLWQRRIAIIATFQFIKKKKEYSDTFAIADLLMKDTHDLIHKAVGWMLREVGKQVSKEVLEEHLKTRYKNMPRTMLRYAIEHFPEKRRKEYLVGKV